MHAGDLTNSLTPYGSSPAYLNGEPFISSIPAILYSERGPIFLSFLCASNAFVKSCMEFSIEHVSSKFYKRMFFIIRCQYILMTIDHDCEICKKGTPKCDQCSIEMKKGESSKTDEGIEITEFICQKCKNKKMDIKMPNSLFDENLGFGE